MFVGQGPAPDPESIRAIVLVVAAAAVIFWRTAIKVLIIGALALIAVGALAAVQGLRL